MTLIYILGKFDTASRKVANVTVSGNSAYVSKTNFKKYANVRQYFIFSNDEGSGNTKTVATTTTTKYVKVSTSLNVRKGAGTSYSIVDSLKNGTKVTVYETKNGWSRIGTNRWVKSSYLSSTKPSTTSSTSYRTTVGKYYRLTTKTYLYSKR